MGVVGLVRLEETVTKEMRGEGLVERCIQGGGRQGRLWLTRLVKESVVVEMFGSVAAAGRVGLVRGTEIGTCSMKHH